VGETIRNPLQAFWDWFTGLPLQHQQVLATLTWTLTTEDTSDFGLSPEEYRQRFLNALRRRDFPLRTMSRLVVVRSMVDFIIQNRKLLQDGSGLGTQGNVISLAEEQWKTVGSGWAQLKAGELSDQNLSRWTRAVLKA
jgi:hypothetical protein